MSERWLKVEMHSHCNLDPHDFRICDYSPEVLIQQAARLRYEALAITCHNLDVWNPGLAAYAEGHGITLIPGMEVSVGGRRHCLVYNFQTVAQNLDSLAKIQALRRENTLVAAPHPFYPARTCLGRELERNLEAFDAIEFSGFYTRSIDFNRKARKLAIKWKIPLVGTADVHCLWQLGRTFTWIYAEPAVDPILKAIRQGRIRVETQPLTLPEAIRWWTSALLRLVYRPRTVRGDRSAAFARNLP